MRRPRQLRHLRHLRDLAFAMLLLRCASPGQGPGKPIARGDQVAGKVVSATDGKPLRRAFLTLNVTEGGKLFGTTTAGDDGSFHFDAVPPGKYGLSAQASGYLAAAYLQHGQFSSAIVTGAGLDTGALVLKLDRNAEIAGRVTDETGAALDEANVVLYREDRQDTSEVIKAERRVHRWRDARTDANGRYEFTGLPPGRYFVAVTATPWYAMHAPAAQPNAHEAYRSAVDPALDVAYPTVFYPHALRSEEATPIALTAGSAVSADLEMTPERAVTLTVRQGTATPGQNAPFPQLSRSFFGDTESVPGSMENDGVNFTFVGLAPGEYKLNEVVGGSPMASQHRATVDLSNGSIAVDPPPVGALSEVDVTVHGGPGSALPEHLNVGLRAMTGDNGGMFMPVSAKHQAVLTGVPEGEYRLLLVADGRLRNAGVVRENGRSVPGRTLHVEGGGTVALDVTLAGAPVVVRGFTKRGGKADVAAMVVLVPAGEDTDGELFRRDQSDLDGSFVLQNVVPGNYVLVAIDDGWGLAWADAKTMLRYLPHGVPVHVGEGGSAVQLSEATMAQAR